MMAVLVFAIAACAPPYQPLPPSFRDRFDSMAVARARAQTPEWRALHYPTPDLHGPLARPPLPVGADTNDATAYYKLGDSAMTREQGLADRAFYWAIRLDPTMADAYYGRWHVSAQRSDLLPVSR